MQSEEKYSPQRFVFKKKNKLKSKKIIEHLYKKGFSVKQYPLRAVFLPYDTTCFEGFEFLPKQTQIGVSVPKRNIKKAVGRNRIKRQMRECYRLNQMMMTRPRAVFFMYLAKEELPYAVLEKAMISCMKQIEERE